MSIMMSISFPKSNSNSICDSEDFKRAVEHLMKAGISRENPVDYVKILIKVVSNNVDMAEEVAIAYRDMIDPFRTKF